MPSLHDLRLDQNVWTQDTSDPDANIWRIEDGGGLQIIFVDETPDHGADPASLDELRRKFQGSIAERNGALVEMNVVSVGGIPATRAISKYLQEPTGMTYMAELQISFESFYYYIVTAFSEDGTTGVRDSVVFAHELREGSIHLGDSAVVGWTWNPYDLTFSERVAPNLSDDPKWDNTFSSHPLSRCRQIVSVFLESVSWSDALCEAPMFAMSHH